MIGKTDSTLANRCLEVKFKLLNKNNSTMLLKNGKKLHLFKSLQIYKFINKDNIIFNDQSDLYQTRLFEIFKSLPCRYFRTVSGLFYQ